MIKKKVDMELIMARKYSRVLIKNEFIKLINQKPYHKITITELVEKCDLNRNTFYYYYEDLLSVLTEVFDDELSKITSGYNSGNTWKDVLMQVTEFARENRKAVFHVYNSMQREELERFLYDFTEKSLRKFVSDECEDMKVNNFDKELIVKFFQMALTGMLIEWISKGMKEDIDFVIERMSLLLDGNVKSLLEHSTRLK